MNKQSGRIGLYLVLIVALIAGYLYLNNQVAVQSDYTHGQLEQAVTDGKVTSATIHQNSEVPTGSVIVNISGEGQKRIYVADVNEAEQLLRESGLDPAVEDVPKQSVFMQLCFPGTSYLWSYHLPHADDEPSDVRWGWWHQCQDDEFRQKPGENVHAG